MEKASEEVKKQVEALQEWAKNNPNCPKDVESHFMLRFLHSCYYDMDKAKNAAERFFKIRSNSPELFADRDPLLPHMKKALGILNLGQYKTADQKNIWIWQLNDPGLENYDYVNDAKVFFISTDAWFLTETELAKGDIIILDVKDITLRLITKINLSVAKKLSKYQQEAMPIRLEQVHIINAPSFFDKIFSLMKPFLKQELTNLIHIHTPNSNTLYEYINKDDLPEDFGGKQLKLEVFMQKTMTRLNENRHRLIRTNLWRIDKTSKNNLDISSDVNNFRTLAID